MRTGPMFFLDVDGVLNHHAAFADTKAAIMAGRATLQSSTFSLDEACVARFMQLVEEARATVVLSSTWRLCDEHKQRLHDVGIRWRWETPHLIKRLPSGVYFAHPRRDEIRDVLRVADPKGMRKAVVFDDDADADLQSPEHLFVHTSMDHGLQDRHVQQVRDWLSLD